MLMHGDKAEIIRHVKTNTDTYILYCSSSIHGSNAKVDMLRYNATFLMLTGYIVHNDHQGGQGISRYVKVQWEMQQH